MHHTRDGAPAAHAAFKIHSPAYCLMMPSEPYASAHTIEKLGAHKDESMAHLKLHALMAHARTTAPNHPKTDHYTRIATLRHYSFLQPSGWCRKLKHCALYDACAKTRQTFARKMLRMRINCRISELRCAYRPASMPTLHRDQIIYYR